MAESREGIVQLRGLDNVTGTLELLDPNPLNGEGRQRENNRGRQSSDPNNCLNAKPKPGSSSVPGIREMDVPNNGFYQGWRWGKRMSKASTHKISQSLGR